jgi:hypothetical protein
MHSAILLCQQLAQVSEVLPAVRPCTWHSEVQQIISLPNLSELTISAGSVTLITI